VLDLLYLPVAVLTVYVGLLYLRRAGPAQRTYAWLLLVDGALAGVAYGAPQLGLDGVAAELVGAVALFGFAGLVVLPPALRSVTRWALAHGRERLAIALCSAREVLTPGLGARQERDVIEAQLAVRSGGADAMLAALRAARTRAREPRDRQALQDRTVMVLLGARRWREAVEAFESRADTVIRPPQIPLFVEVVNAYGELGDLAGAARVLAFLERLPGIGEPLLAPHIARARLLFLAWAGRPEALEAVFAADPARAQLAEDARAYWLGVAQRAAGQLEAARALLVEAAQRATDPRRRALAEERLASLRGLEGAEPVALTPEQAAFADEVAARALAAVADAPPVLEGLRPGATPVTWVLIAANLGVQALVVALLHSTTDSWSLARAGANFAPAVAAGEWWRLVACTLLHVGGLHIGVNMFGLWRLGTVVEQIVGPLRFAAIYVLAAIAGSLATYHFGNPGLSAGASGAVFGVLGAAIVELWLRRGAGRPQAWRATLLNNLLLIAAINLFIGSVTPVIDQSAHVGGLLGGALAGLVLSPRTRLGGGRVGRALAMAVCAAGLAALALTGWGVATSPYPRTVARIGWKNVTLDGVRVQVPAHWQDAGKDVLAEPLWLSRTMTVDRLPAADFGAVFHELSEHMAQESDVAEVTPIAPSFSAPEGWTVRELRFVAVVDKERVPIREAIFLRLAGGQTVVLGLLVPEAVTAEVRPVIERIVESAEVGRAPTERPPMKP
jgi:membrane associated rhomboid family serine protease